MIFLAISLPLGFLCLYLGCLGWRKNQRVSAMLLIFAALNLGFSLAVSTLVLFLSQRLGLL